MHKKNLILLLNFVIVILLLLLVYSGYKWYLSDDSGESLYSISLAIITFVIWLKKISIKQNKIVEDFNIVIKRKEIRCFNLDIDYVIHIDCELFAYKQMSIKTIKLSYKETHSMECKTRILDNFLKTSTNFDNILSYDFEKIKTLIQSSDKLTDFPMKIDESNHLLFSFIEHIKGEQFSDGYEGIKLKDWELVLEYNDNQVKKIDIVLEPHKDSIKVPVKYEFRGFIE